MARLLVDAMCGDLVPYLRMCGHDAAYAPDRALEADDALLAAVAAEDRTIVTRDRQLAARADDAVLLESQETETQLATLLESGVDLELSAEPERCGACNGRLARLDDGASTPADVPDPEPEPVWRCEACGQHFWRGSHWDRVATTLDRVREDS